MPLAFAFQHPGLEGGKREKSPPERKHLGLGLKPCVGTCLYLLAGGLVPVEAREAPKGLEQGQPRPGVEFCYP